MNIENKEINLIAVGSSHIDIFIGKILDKKTMDILGFQRVNTEGAIMEGEIKNFPLASTKLKTALSYIEETLKEKHPGVNSKLKEFYITLPMSIGKVNYGFTGYPSGILLKEKLCKQEDKDVLDEKCLKRAKRVRDNQVMIDFIDRAYFCDRGNIHTDPYNQTMKRLYKDYLFYSVKSETKLKWDRLMTDLNITVKNYLFESIFSFMTIFKEEEIKRGSVLVDIGAYSTTITAFKDHLIGSQSISIGSKNITEDICRHFKCSFNVGESLKYKYHSVHKAYEENPRTVMRYKKINGQTVKLPLQMLRELTLLKIKEFCKYIHMILEHLINLDRLFQIKRSIILNNKITGKLRREVGNMINEKIKFFINAEGTLLNDEKIKDIIHELYNKDGNLYIGFEEEVYDGFLLVAGGGSKLYYDKYVNYNTNDKEKSFLFETYIRGELNNLEKYQLDLKTEFRHGTEFLSEYTQIYDRPNIAALGSLSYLHDYEENNQRETEDSFEEIASIRDAIRQKLNI